MRKIAGGNYWDKNRKLKQISDQELFFHFSFLIFEQNQLLKGNPLLLPRENGLGRSFVLLVSLLLSVYPFLLGCRADNRPQVNPLSKITFNLGKLNENGLYGPPHGLKALHYEFCIPGDHVHEAQVRQIDPTIQIFKTSPGRVGCAEGEYLCVGSTHQPDFKTVLLKLAKLPYVKRIDQAFFE